MRFAEYYYTEGFKEIISKLKGAWGKLKNPIVNAFQKSINGIKSKFTNAIQKSYGFGLKVVSQLINMADIDTKQKEEIKNALGTKDLVQAIKSIADLNKKYKPSPDEVKEAGNIGQSIGAKVFKNTKTESYDIKDIVLTEGFLDNIKKSLSNPNVLRNTILLVLLFALFAPIFGEGLTEIANGIEYIVKGLEFQPGAEPTGQIARDVIIRGFSSLSRGETMLNNQVIDSMADFFKVTVGTYLKAGTNEVISNMVSMTMETEEGMKQIFQYFPTDATPAQMGQAITDMLKDDPEKAKEIITKLKLI